MVGVFVLWTIGFIFGSGPIAKLIGADTEPSGEVSYIEPWLPWLGVTLLWVLPLVAGIGLAVLARRTRKSRLSLVGLVLNATILAASVGPAFLGRLFSA
jgi:hypothetical protein